MTDNDLIFRNPIRLLGDASDEHIFGAVLARAGVGKTAFLVQIAIDGLLRNKNVLHVGIDDSVKKVSLWYEEVFKNLATRSDLPEQELESTFEKLLPKRFIMTFKTEGFSISNLQERLADFTEQNIFRPDIVIIDSFPFDKEELGEFKKFARIEKLDVWFAILTHRSDKLSRNRLPKWFAKKFEVFEKVILLRPDDNINVEILKGVADDDPVKSMRLILEPSTMKLEVED